MTEQEDHETATRYTEARLRFVQAANQVLETEIAFVLTPTIATTTDYRVAHHDATAAQVELNDAQYARIMHVTAAGQLARLVAEQLEARLQFLEELGVENRDGQKHVSGLIATLIERLESPISGRRRLEGETE